MQHIIDLIPFFLTDEIRQNGVGSYGKTYDQIHEKTYQCHTASYRRQCIVAGESAYHRHIRGIKKLLQYTAECQRYGKQNQLSCQAAVQHIHFSCIFHRQIPRFCKSSEKALRKEIFSPKSFLSDLFMTMFHEKTIPQDPEADLSGLSDLSDPQALPVSLLPSRVLLLLQIFLR